MGFCERVLHFTSGMDKSTFLADRRTYDAVLRNLELLGEAARNIPDSVRDAHLGIPWKAIIGMRNRLAHAYMSVDDEVIWNMICDHVPVLLRALRRISLD